MRRSPPDRLGRWLLRCLAGTAVALVIPAARAAAASDPEPELARAEFFRGHYESALAQARAGREESPYVDEWYRLEAESLLALGRYAEAHEAVVNALKVLRGHIRLRLVGLRTARMAGQPGAAALYLSELRGLVVNQARYVRDVPNLVAVGEAALLLEVEPRLVLENFFKPGREAEPPVRDAFLATGRLALEKNDDGLASRTFQQGIAAFPGDPDMWAGLAASFLDGDRRRLVEYATQALELNPRHAPAHALLAEHLIDAEDYAGAQEQLDRILEVNALDPDALALGAVLAELRNDSAEAKRLRARALSTWDANPRVDHLIGRKLSQKYRFAEGSAYQRAALDLDAGYAPARRQLALDLLRLGREDEGWPLAGEVHAADAYDVTAFNLVTLRDRIGSFTTLTTPHFRLRMSAREAAIYGQRALALLERAHATLTARYGLVLEQPVTVEIYPEPKDFAVRTFGMPDNPGFLGVCFGPVVTINSPGTRQANWEAVLWHEFTHVITLTQTRNRMPRWLSEGISVFEELRENPAWGQRMNLDYRTRILEGRMQPISRMSAAFLTSEGGEDLQFAYFQSYLAVRFIVETYGFEKLRALLAALADGTDTNAAVTATLLGDASAAIDELDTSYASYARETAKQLGAGLDLAKPKDALGAALAQLSPRSYHGRLERAEAAIAAKDWGTARPHLEAITADGLYLDADPNPHRLLAGVCRALGDTAAELAAWTTIATHEGDALDAVSRLLDLAVAAHEHDATVRWAEHWLAIHPLAPTPWRALLTAHEARGDFAAAAAAGGVLLKLDPPDRPAIHYRVAQALRDIDVESSRLNVLLALEEAPRFRAAHELLAQLPPSPALADAGLEVQAPPP